MADNEKIAPGRVPTLIDRLANMTDLECVFYEYGFALRDAARLILTDSAARIDEELAIKTSIILSEGRLFVLSQALVPGSGGFPWIKIKTLLDPDVPLRFEPVWPLPKMTEAQRLGHVYDQIVADHSAAIRARAAGGEA